MPTLTSAVRGIRNCNPFNLRRTNDKWQGLRKTQTDPEFFQFEAFVWGIRAGVMVLTTYRDKHGLFTVRSIIDRFAPPHENNTTAYVESVCKRLLVAPDDIIDTRQHDVMFKLVRAIIRHEVGAAASLLVTDDTVRSGIALAPLATQRV